MQSTKNNKKTSKRKSVALEPTDKAAIKSLIKLHRNNLSAVADELGVSRQVLGRMLLVGSTHPKSLQIIRKKLSKAA